VKAATVQDATRPAPPEAPPSACPGPRRQGLSSETWAWLFMRLSGLVLVIMALLHFGITHILNDVVETDFDFLAQRWANPLWRVFDWVLLALALLHGLVGVRTIIDDYVRRTVLRGMVKAVVYTVSLFLLAYGSLTIVGFQPMG
jgi:succinate dehydrogenase / fumarate reductase membrane anchor subunit